MCRADTLHEMNERSDAATAADAQEAMPSDAAVVAPVVASSVAQLAVPPLRPSEPSDAAAEIRRRRVAAAIVAAASGGLLGVAWFLKASPRGFGTHEALGLPPCSWPSRFGVPCPSCGMTTAFAYAAKGDLLASFAAQPMGCVLAVLTGMALVGSLWTLVTGRSLWPVYARLWGARAAWALGLAALASWAYKIAVMRGWME